MAMSRALGELYLARDEQSLRSAAAQLYTYLGGTHDVHRFVSTARIIWKVLITLQFRRAHMPAELRIRTGIALNSLSEIFPGDGPTIEWLEIIEMHHRATPR